MMRGWPRRIGGLRLFETEPGVSRACLPLPRHVQRRVRPGDQSAEGKEGVAGLEREQEQCFRMGFHPDARSFQIRDRSRETNRGQAIRGHGDARDPVWIEHQTLDGIGWLGQARGAEEGDENKAKGEVFHS